MFTSDYFKTIPNILRQHHFIFSKDQIGKVEIKVVDGERCSIDIRKTDTMPTGFPEEILPKGLSIERQWYLYEQVRNHIQNPDKRDDLCPKPMLPKSKQKKT